MKDLWYLLFIAILCALFSKQIDAMMTRVIKDPRKRVVLLCVFCSVMLVIIGFLIHGALNRI